jgi:hypothetical protein
MWIPMHAATVNAALLLAFGLLSPAAHAATGAAATGPEKSTGSFEGDVTMQITMDRTNGPEKVTAHVKGNRVRYDLPPSSNAQHQPLTAIVDMGRKHVMLVMPSQKTYAVLDMNQIPPQSRQATAQRVESAAADWKASPTGRTQSLAGHDCHQWEATNTKTSTKVEACLAPGVRIDFDKLLPSSMVPATWSDRLRNGELPLAATVYGADGRQTFNEEVTHVTPRIVPDSEFAAPTGYERIDLPPTAFGDLLPTAR